MYKALNKAKTLDENKTLVNKIENKFTNLIKILKSTLKSDAKKWQIIFWRLLSAFFTLMKKIKKDKQ